MTYATKHKSFAQCKRCGSIHSVSQHRHHGLGSFEAVRGGRKTKTYSDWQDKYTKTGKAKTTTKRKTTKRKTTKRKR